MNLLLDTNTCISVMRGHPAVRAKMEMHSPQDIGVSMVTWYELWTGVHLCRKPEKESWKIEKFIAPLHLLAFDERPAKRAAEVRAHLQANGKVIGPYDLLLAGHALAMDVTLVTNNIREFERVPGLRVEDWTGS